MEVGSSDRMTVFSGNSEVEININNPEKKVEIDLKEVGQVEVEEFQRPTIDGVGKKGKTLMSHRGLARPKCEEKSTLMKIFFPLQWIYEWATKFVFKGVKLKFTVKDIPSLSSSLKVEGLVERFAHCWDKTKEKKKRLFWTLVFCFWKEVGIAGGLCLIGTLMYCCQPIFMKLLLAQMKPPFTDEVLGQFREAALILPPDIAPSVDDAYEIPGYRYNEYSVWIWCTALVLNSVLQVVIAQYGVFCSEKTGIRMKSVLISKIYEKLLKISNKERKRFEDGEILNYCTTDLMIVDRVFGFLHFVWTGVVAVVFCLFFVIPLVEFASLGHFVYIIAIPFLLVPIISIFIVKRKMLKMIDRRVVATNEVFQKIRQIKYLGWENFFKRKILTVRKEECKLFQALLSIQAFLFTLLELLPSILCVVTFVMYFLMYNDVDTITIFTTMTFFNVVRKPLNFLPMTCVTLTTLSLSLKRIESFLCAFDQPEVKIDSEKDVPVQIKEGSFQWETQKKEKKGLKSKKRFGEKKKPVEVRLKKQLGLIEKIDLQVKRGDLVIVIGPVGSGKSSLLHSIIGDLRKTEGEMKISGSVALVRQRPWILNDTLLENVLFGRLPDEKRVNSVFNICGLSNDLKVLKGGRMIEIGEKGVTLSGGQRLRIALARAVYSNSDIYLLDDILGSVDPHIGKHIFETCILGELGRKTRLFVTHQLQYVSYADYVIVMGKKTIEEQGKYEDLINKENSKLCKLLGSQLSLEKKKGGKEFRSQKKKKHGLRSAGEQKKESTVKKEGLGKRYIPPIVWWRYCMAMGFVAVVLIVITTVVAHVFLVGMDVVMSQWSNQSWNRKLGNEFNTSYFLNSSTNENQYYDFSNSSFENQLCSEYICDFTNVEIFWDATFRNDTIVQEGLSQMDSLLLYFAIGLVGVLLLFIKSCLLHNCSIVASRKLFKRALRRTMNAPMKFFDTQKIGRILNRFSQDMWMIDKNVGMHLNKFMFQFCTLTGMFVIFCVFTNGLFAFILVPLVIFYFLIFLVFRISNLNFVKLVAITRSMVMSNVVETLQGVPSIRAYKKKRMFMSRNKKKINTNAGARFMVVSLQKWLSVRLSLSAALIVLSVVAGSIIIFFYFNDFFLLNISGFALMISYSLQVSNLVGQFILKAIEMEKYANSIERIQEYDVKMDVEQDLVSKYCENFPRSSKVEFRNFSMRYRPELPLVLKNVSFEIKCRERIGIVGMSGSGKSSIIMSLFRFVEGNGSILIGNQDIRSVPLSQLRNSLSLIAQDKALFQGTIRSNLDPNQEYTDLEVWDALEKSNMRHVIEKLEKGLNHPVGNKGSFSVGETTLLCLGRALLKKSVILILDEFSSSVDESTLSIIQKTLDDHFKNCTIISIAHKLHTIILGNSRVLVLGDPGQTNSETSIIEYGKPIDLIFISTSKFLHFLKKNRNFKKIVQALLFKEEKNCVCVCQATFERKPTRNDELRLKIRDELVVYKINKDGWHNAYNKSSEEWGLFPFNFTNFEEVMKNK